MKARFEICSCPSISVGIDEARGRGKDFEVSVFLTETGGANYSTDPSGKSWRVFTTKKTYRKKL